jgi:hypothetical protein
MSRRKYAKPTPEEFILAWQCSTTTAQVARKLRMTTAQVRVRACRYRQHGVPLKEYAVPEPPDWEKLAAYAQSLVAPTASKAPPVANEPTATARGGPADGLQR